MSHECLDFRGGNLMSGKRQRLSACNNRAVTARCRLMRVMLPDGSG